MSLVFFTDRDLGKQFPSLLRSAGLFIERHDDHFPPTAPDQEWLRAAGERGWVALTHDKRIRYKPNELQAVLVHRVALLVVVGHAAFADLAISFIATRGRIERFVARHAPPYIAKVHRAARSELARNPMAAGRIEMWYRGGASRGKGMLTLGRIFK